MKLPESNSPVKNHEKTSIVCRIFPGLLLVTTVFFIGSAFMVTDYKERFSSSTKVDVVQCPESAPQEIDSRPKGTESLPRGFISETTDFELRPLWGPVKKKSNETMNLLAITVGIKQKENVNKIVQKFLKHDFSVILFHYDGNVNGWDDLEWNQRVNHVAARAQTKWWFAKRYLQPDVVASYGFIFLWDEDVDVDNFHVDRYLSIIRSERLQISQPAIEPHGSEIHHEITARQESKEVHRRTDKELLGGMKCENNTGPPCAGWVEMMVPVFSRASWRCVWHMIQNDLVISWGLDFQLGYCAQGNRSENIGVVDSEYIVHRGVPILGGTSGDPKNVDTRREFRQKAFAELQEFKSRWINAIQADKTWKDPYNTNAK